MQPIHSRIDWSSVLRHGLQVQAFCCVVAVFTTMVWPLHGYAHQWVYSTCIGMLTWLTIEFGRLLVPQAHCHHDPGSSYHGWPKGWRGLVLVACGNALGFTAGMPLARLLLGDPAPTPQRDLTLALLLTVGAGVMASAYFHARSKQAALQARLAAAERDTSEARLMLLQSQLEPHMLFNTLATLRALIAADPLRAEAMLDRMVDFLRATLSVSRAPLHPLSAEFARLADYLELMSVRMGPRLVYALDLPPGLANTPVPPLLLQPLVENAIRHGLEPHVAGGRIDVRAQRLPDGRIQVDVVDTGVGHDPAASPRAGRGFGLAQVRERLANRYGSSAALGIQAMDEGGTAATIAFPSESP